jgi:hypothetical protein
MKFLFHKEATFGLAICLFLIYEPNGLAYRWWQIKIISIFGRFRIKWACPYGRALRNMKITKRIQGAKDRRAE